MTQVVRDLAVGMWACDVVSVWSGVKVHGVARLR